MFAKKRIEVRRATPDDLPVMRELVKHAYIQKGYLTPQGDITYPDLASEQHIALVATCNNLVVGTIMVSFGPPSELPIASEFPSEIHEVWHCVKNRNIAYIGRLAVDKEFREERVSPLLFRMVALYCLLRRVQAVTCIVNPHHEEFYLKRGFERVSGRPETAGLINAPASFLVFYRKKSSLLSIAKRWISGRTKMSRVERPQIALVVEHSVRCDQM